MSRHTYQNTKPWEHPPWEGEATHGWIQWKGTDVCLDLRCECGALTHFDGEFAYALECSACGRTYAMNPHVKAHPIDPEKWDGCDPRRTDEASPGVADAVIRAVTLPAEIKA